MVGLTNDGKVLATGFGYDNKLDEATNDSNLLNAATWVDINEIAAGTGFTIGLTADGVIPSVGYKKEGQRNLTDNINSM